MQPQVTRSTIDEKLKRGGELGRADETAQNLRVNSQQKGEAFDRISSPKK